jgi:PIN domain nuclease of toxin-antitoxin system
MKRGSGPPMSCLIRVRFGARCLKTATKNFPWVGQHGVAVDVLPSIHKDPFDRILIAQAMVEGITLLTADPVIASYPGPIRTV